MKTYNKVLSIIFLLMFISTGFYIRSYINDTIIPAREALVLETLQQEIDLIYSKYAKKKYKDSKQSSIYILEAYTDRLNDQTTDELNLVIVKSSLNIMKKEEDRTNIEKVRLDFENLSDSQFPNVKVDALIGIAECYMFKETVSVVDVDNSINLLEQALDFSQDKELENKNLEKLIAINLIEKYEITKEFSSKSRAIEILIDRVNQLKESVNIEEYADSLVDLSLAYVKISFVDQLRTNLRKATEQMELASTTLPRKINPNKNARIMRMLGDVYYLRSKMPRLHNEAGPLYIQNVVRFQAISKRAYRKAEQMGVFHDIVPGVQEMRMLDAENRKRIESVNDNDGGGPMRTVIIDDEKIDDKK